MLTSSIATIVAGAPGAATGTWQRYHLPVGNAFWAPIACKPARITGGFAPESTQVGARYIPTAFPSAPRPAIAAINALRVGASASSASKPRSSRRAAELVATRSSARQARFDDRA